MGGQKCWRSKISGVKKCWGQECGGVNKFTNLMCFLETFLHLQHNKMNPTELKYQAEH